ncbi:MAG: FAD-dependent oxidoreductase [bacterium]|nr:FAD-dependent oxidoreductase [bacterium]
MKIAVLGGGLAGMTASYELNKKGHDVVLFEKQNDLGGLASGFKQGKWDWYLEKNIHHLFANDKEILAFAKKIGFNEIIFKTTKTGSLYSFNNNSRIIPLDKPLHILQFPYLGIFSKLRTAFTLTFLKVSPFIFLLYEKLKAEQFIKFTMGKKAWNVLWKELFRKKFGKYAGIILSSFLWARIKKRTKKLGYFHGGFNSFINHLEGRLIEESVEIKKNHNIVSIKRERKQYVINNKKFDAVISTLPTPILIEICKDIFPIKYLNKLKKLKYMHAISLVLQTKSLIFEEYYWVNILDNKNEIMGIVQHTNFMDKQNYDNNHIIYVYNYFPINDKKIKLTKDEIYNFYLKNLKRIDSNIESKIKKYDIFFGPYAQPIFDKEFLKNKPDFKTPLKNFFIANLDMTYPYDRGTNYAVKLGKKVANIILKETH